ncbi:MAG: hypothetical protein FGM15_12525 [Chthoniobacterales bacterium]|nr:hypothetical protein [Chthoniobacterales bacterium]
MESTWFVWLAAGLLLAAAGSLLGSLEAVLWQTPRERMDQWPASPRLRLRAADFAHPRDCLFTFFALGSALARGTGWWALWTAGLLASRQVAGPAWAWILGLLGAVVLVEVLPCALAARRPRAWERPLLRVGAVVWRVFGPFFDRIQQLVAFVARKIFPWSLESRAQLGPEEVETLVRVREEEGRFTMQEAEVLTEVLRLSRATVRHYMMPRVDVMFIEDEMSNDDVRALLVKNNVRRAPVVGETPDEVVGLLDTRTFGRLPTGMHFTEALLPPSFVPETMEASTLLAGFLKHRQPLAVVLDEFGGVEGVVTLEDFIEEILEGAAPRVESDLYIEQLGDGRLLAAGNARLDDLGEYLGFDATREGIETIGGYVIHQLGRLPRQGSSVRLGPWKVTVRSMAQRRVREVALKRVRLLQEEES